MDQSSPALPKAKRLEGPGNKKPNGPKKSSQIRPMLPLTEGDELHAVLITIKTYFLLV